MCSKNDVKLSKLLSWLLRHGALKEGLNFDDGGFIDVEKILKLKQFRNYNLEDIQRVSETNDKRRFSMRYKAGILQIRANQGHSIQIDENELLTLLTEDTVPDFVYHGTYLRNLEPIKSDGLSRMRRNHIHFTPKLPGEKGVISGMRQDSEIFVVVNAKIAVTHGYKFYESDNCVILCPGDENGRLPASYIKEIWQVNPLKQLY